VHNISSKSLRNQCGVVLQEGFIFSETIEKNIILSKEKDEKQFKRATEISKVDEFISSLALQENTKIGSAGSGISGGQKQRILIARAIYKSPKLFIFDEATSSLDTKNEKLIYNALNEYLEGKTSIVIAHRLSTVKDADQIIVLDKGHLAEIGTHQELVQKRGIYFNLVQNQLELN
jgi:ATP-binding cassette, subfamily B, bacterial